MVRMSFLSDPERGLGICCCFRGDKYHRSWRDYQWAVNKAEGEFAWTTIQLNYICNVNYQPFGVGSHFTKRLEMRLDWERLFPKAGPDFSCLAKNISLDARIPPPTGLGGVQQLYQSQLLGDTMSTKAGTFMKQGAWYDIIRAIDKYDPLWHCRRYEMEEVARFLQGSGNESKAFVKAVAAQLIPNSEDTSKENYRSHMRHLRKAAGNCLLLAPKLMTNNNLVNSRIMLLVAKVMWSEQTFWAIRKITPEQDRELSIQYADGLGDKMVKQMWINSIGDARELHRMGIRTRVGADIIDVSQSTGLGENDRAEGVPLHKVRDRLMSFLSHFGEARLWSYAWQQFAYPEAFAGLLSSMCAVDAFEYAQELWSAATDVEANAHIYPGAWVLRQEIYWLSWTLVQFVLRWLAHLGFRPCRAFHAFCACFFSDLGTPRALRNPTR